MVFISFKINAIRNWSCKIECLKIQYSKSSITILQIAGCICIILGLLAGIAAAVVLIVLNVTKASSSTNTTDTTLNQTFYDMVNYWKIEDQDMTDRVGTGQPISSSGTSYVTNRLSESNQALDLNGGTIDIQPGAYLYGHLTIMLWLKLIATPAKNAGILDCYNSPAPTDDLSLFISKRRNIGANIYWGSSYFLKFQSYYQIPLDTWTHVAYTWNGPDFILYTNGKFDVNVTLGDYLPLTSRSTCIFGSFSAESSAPLFSYLDEIRVYNRFNKSNYIIIVFLLTLSKFSKYVLKGSD